MPDTVILKNEENLQGHLQRFLNNRRSPLTLCYRASLHGWSSQQFHQKCDKIAGTVVLVKVENYIFGGYTDQTWEGKNFTEFPHEKSCIVRCEGHRFSYDLKR